jgi:hypothetical protein
VRELRQRLRVVLQRHSNQWHLCSMH